MGYTSVPGLTAEQRGPVLHLTLDRADRRNAVNDVMLDAMIDQFAAVGIDESVRVVRIDAAGPDFCAGADLIANNAKSERKPRVGSTQRRLPNKANRLIPLMLETQVPIVSVVRGWAAGLGFHIAMASDFCVAADDARLWEPFMSRGFTPDSGAAWLLPRLIGMVRTRQLLMLGEEISGAVAAEWGIIHGAHIDSELSDAADQRHKAQRSAHCRVGADQVVVAERERTRPRPPSPERSYGARTIQS